MYNVNQSIITAFTYLTKMSSKNYCYPSQEGILKILRERYHTTISLRTLNYHLRVLENDNYIKRVRRIKRGPDNKPLFASTLYFIKKKVFSYLKKQAEFLQAIGFKIRVAYSEQKNKARSESRALKFDTTKELEDDWHRRYKELYGRA